MAYKNRFFKTTLGVDAQVQVAKAVEYTDDTTLKDFAANAVEGEIALINGSTNAVLTSAPAAGTPIFFALKRDGNVETTTSFPFSTAVVTKVAYIAPVKHVITITNPGVAATLTSTGGDVRVTALEAGTAGNSITLTVVDGAGNNIALSVSVTGTAITVNLATDGSSAPTSTAAQVIAAINANADAAALVIADLVGTASDVQAAMSVTSLAGGTAETDAQVADFEKGTYGEIVIIETTPGLEPLPRWEYSLEALANETFGDFVRRLVAKINSATSAENVGKTLIVTAANVTGNDITLTAIDYNSHFTVALRGVFADAGSSFAVTTQFKFGSGTPEQALIAEKYGDYRKGIGHEYPEQAMAVAADFGVPTSFVSTSNTYNIYKVEWSAEDQTRTLGKEFRKNYIFVYVPSNGTNPDSEIDTII